MKRLINIFKLAWTVWRYTGRLESWQRGDAVALKGFLASGTGYRMDLAMTEFILDEGQKALAGGGSAFEAGRATGMKQLWVFMHTLSLADVTPEHDEDEK